MTLAGCPPRSPQAPENDKKPGSLVHDFRAFRYVIVCLARHTTVQKRLLSIRRAFVQMPEKLGFLLRQFSAFP